MLIGAVVAAAIIVAAVAAFSRPLTFPQDLAGAQDKGNSSDIVPAIDTENPAPEKCDAVSGSITMLVVNVDSEGTNQTRKDAASLLVQEYCQRPPLVQEISAMASPGMSLVAYACDAASGRTGDDLLQDSLKGYVTIYCESAFISIIEEAEDLISEADNYREELQVDLEEDMDEQADGGNSTSPAVNMDEVDRNVEEIKELARQAKALARADQYYEAAKKLDNAMKLFRQLE